MTNNNESVFVDDVPFSSGDILRLTGCGNQNLMVWVRQGIVTPTHIANGATHGRMYSFASVLAVFVVERLRLDLGLTPKRVLPVFEWIAGHKSLRGPRIDLTRIPGWIDFDGTNVTEDSKVLKGDVLEIHHGGKRKVCTTADKPWTPNGLVIEIGSYSIVLIERIKELRGQ